MAEFRVTGANQLEALGKRFKAEGDAGKGLRKETLKALQKASKPLKAEAKAAALADLPHRGGLDKVVAASLFSARTKLSARDASLRIQVKGKKVHDVKSTDAGRIRHPVFGRWVPGLPPQQIEPGWFTNAMEKAAPDVRKEISGALDEIAHRIGA